MKKILFIVIIFPFLFSCDSSDDEKSSEIPKVNELQAKLVGTWIEESLTTYASDGTVKSTIDYGTTPCYGMSTYTFLSDKVYLAETFDYDSNSKVCIENSTINGSWRIASADELIITVKATGAKIVEKTIIESVTTDELVLTTINVSTNAVTSSIEYYKVR